MTKYVPDSEVDVQKFAGYWKGDAPFDRVIYRNIPTAATQKLDAAGRRHRHRHRRFRPTPSAICRPTRA